RPVPGRPLEPSRRPGTRPAVAAHRGQRAHRARPAARPGGPPGCCPTPAPRGWPCSSRYSPAPPGNGDGHVVEPVLDRRFRLVHRDVDRHHPGVGQAHVGEPLGKRLDQVHGLALNHVDQAAAQFAVVDRVREAVSPRGRTRVHTQDHVHDELLPLVPFEVEHPVPAPGPEPAYRDPIQRFERLSHAPSRSSWRTTGEAWCDHIRQPCSVSTNRLVATTRPPATNPGSSSSAVSTFSSQVTMAIVPLTPTWVPVSTYWMYGMFAMTSDQARMISARPRSIGQPGLTQTRSGACPSSAHTRSMRSMSPVSMAW